METSSHRLLRLDADQILRIDAASNQCVVIFHGKVWITQQGDLRDYVLEAGESFAFDHAGLGLVEALEPTSLALLFEANADAEPIGYEAAWPSAEPTARAPRREPVAEPVA